MMRNIVLFSLVIFLCASVVSAQNHVGLFLGGSKSTGSYSGGNFVSTSLTPSGNIAPSAGVQFCPMCLISGGAEYDHMRAKGATSAVLMSTMNGSPLESTTTSLGIANRVFLGNVSIGFGNKNIRAFGGFLGGMSAVRESYDQRVVANVPQYTDLAAQDQLPPGTRNYILPVYGGAGGVRFAKGHFGGEIRVGYLVPFGIVITPRIGFYF